MEKIRKKLAGWKGKLLNLSGRLVLTNSIITSIPLYWMSSLLLPRFVIQKIDKIQRSFVWRGFEECKSGHCRVQWSSICRPKQFGGLGVINLKVFSRILLEKWWWKLYTNVSDSWCKLLNTLHPNHQWRLRQVHKSPSAFWEGLEAVQNIFQQLIKYSANNGNRALFWKDCWIYHRPLKDLCPNWYAVIPNCFMTVARGMDFLCNGRLSGSLILLRFKEDLDRINRSIRHVSLTESYDSIEWKWFNDKELMPSKLHRFQ